MVGRTGTPGDQRMTATSQQRTGTLRRVRGLRLRGNPEQRPDPQPDRLRIRRFGDENQGIRADRGVSARAGRGTMSLNGPATAPGQVKSEMSAQLVEWKDATLQLHRDAGVARVNLRRTGDR